MAEHNELGALGEQIAVDYLISKGHDVLDRNYRFKHLELDIVTKHEGQLVVVEVKTRQSDYLTDPTELLSKKKQSDIIKAADHYINEKEIDIECRFDVIIIVLNEKQKDLQHIEDAFYPQV